MTAAPHTTPVTAAAALVAIAPALPDALVSPRAGARMRATARTLPLTPAGVLECHLGNPERVDLALRLQPGDPGRELLGLGPADDASRWTHDVWLERDLAPGEPPMQGVIVGPGPAGEGGPPPRPRARAAWLAALERLAQAAVDPDVRAAVEDVWDRLPEPARMHSLCWLPGRGGVRLVIGGVPLSQAGALLDAVAWEGDRDAVERLRADVGEFADAVRLLIDLDVEGPALGPVLGLNIAGVDAPWGALLPPLLAGLPEARDLAAALLSWPGVTRAGRGPWGVLRALNHVKLVHAPGVARRPKAYLAWQLRPKEARR